MAYPILGKDVPKMPCAIEIARSLERIETGRGLSVPGAWRSIARKIRKGPGTIEHLVRGRAKSIDAALRDKLQALLVHELELEIGRLQHDLEIARQTGAHLASDEISEVESHLAAARTLLNRGGR